MRPAGMIRESSVACCVSMCYKLCSEVFLLIYVSVSFSVRCVGRPSGFLRGLTSAAANRDESRIQVRPKLTSPYHSALYVGAFMNAN